ncbi:MAG TPA: hypothetical protein VI703_05230 [Anaerolineales bacterium]|jgi:hypothetical protein|nr:hypothetical protein [Anaerolineales bacterium]
MQDILIHSLLAYLLCPAVVYYAVRTMNIHGNIRSPKVWWAVGSGVYGTFAVIFGLTQGARVGDDIGKLTGWQDPWIAIVLSAGLSLALSIWMLLVAEARYRPTTVEGNE